MRQLIDCARKRSLDPAASRAVDRERIDARRHSPSTPLTSGGRAWVRQGVGGRGCKSQVPWHASSTLHTLWQHAACHTPPYPSSYFSGVSADSRSLCVVGPQEARLDENLTPHQADANHAAGKDGDEGGNAGAYRAILDRLEVTISRIDFTYHDKSGTLGAHIESIALENHKPTESSDLLEHTIKSAKLIGFSLWVRASESGARGQHGSPSSEGISETAATSPCYILHPCAASVRIGYDTPKAKFDLSRPRISVVAEIPELAMLLRREQLLCIVKVADMFDDKARERFSHPGRPVLGVTQDPKAWWRYAQTIVIEDIRERRRRRSAAFLLDRRQHRKRYADLYLRHRSGKAQGNEVKEMEAIEERLGFHDIVFFRCTAIRQVQLRSDGQMSLSRREPASKKSAWSFTGWGWKSSKTGREEGGAGSGAGCEAGAGSAAASQAPTPENVAAAEAGGGGMLSSSNSNPFHGMTPEEREALFSAMAGGSSDLGVTYTSLMQSQNPEQQLYIAAVSLGSCSARLVDPGQLDCSASFNDATVKVKGRVQAATWQGELLSLNVSDLLRHRPLCKQHNTVSTPSAAIASGSDLLSMDIITDRAATPPRTGICMRVAALDLTADPTFLSSFAAFWQVHHASRYDRAQHSRNAAAKPAGAAAGDESSSVLALGRDEVLSLDIDIQAPNIYICEHGSRGFNGSVVMVRLGHLSIKDLPDESGAAEEAAAAQSNEARDQSGSVQHQVNSKNRYEVQVERVGVDLLEHAEVQEDDVYCESTAAIVKDTRLRACVSSSLVLAPAEGVRDEIAIDATLPSLSVCVSRESLLDLTRIIASWSKSREAQLSAPGEEVLARGWVPVKGLLSQEGWCWRWISLQRDSMEFFRDDEGAVLDQMVSLSVVQASSEHCRGLWVISLQPSQDDSHSDSTIQIYAASQHSAMLSLIWQAQVNLSFRCSL